MPGVVLVYLLRIGSTQAVAVAATAAPVDFLVHAGRYQDVAAISDQLLLFLPL